MKFKSILIIYAVLHIVLIFVGQLKLNNQYNSIITFLLFFYFSIYCIKKFGDDKPTWKILFTLIMIRLLLLGGFDLYVRLTEELYGSPILIIHLLGIISGFFYLRLKNPFNFLPFILSSIFVVFMFFQGWVYYHHKLDFGTFTGKVSFPLPAKFEAFDENKSLITEENFNNKIVLLDFWHIQCGVCYTKFPQVQALYEKYKNDSSVMVLAVNKPNEEDKANQAFEIIKEKGYSFPVVITKEENLAEKFGVKYYPTVFVINSNGQVVYKGNIENAVKIVDELKK